MFLFYSLLFCSAEREGAREWAREVRKTRQRGRQDERIQDKKRQEDSKTREDKTKQKSCLLLLSSILSSLLYSLFSLVLSLLFLFSSLFSSSLFSSLLFSSPVFVLYCIVFKTRQDKTRQQHTTQRQDNTTGDKHGHTRQAQTTRDKHSSIFVDSSISHPLYFQHFVSIYTLVVSFFPLCLVFLTKSFSVFVFFVFWWGVSKFGETKPFYFQSTFKERCRLNRFTFKDFFRQTVIGPKKSLSFVFNSLNFASLPFPLSFFFLCFVVVWDEKWH
jgi:hypothetical protein